MLACADGSTSTDVARRCRTSNQTVCKWRRRFLERRLDGLFDEPRVGAPRKISDAQVERACQDIAAQLGELGESVGWRIRVRPEALESRKLSEAVLKHDYQLA